MAPSEPSTVPQGEPPVWAWVDTPPPAYASNSPVLPSQNTIRPSLSTAGPSGKPRPEASSVDSKTRSSRRLDERVVLEVEVGQRLAHPGGRVSGDLGAVRVQRSDEGRDDVPPLVEVDHLHLVLDLLAGRWVRCRVSLLVQVDVVRQAPVRLVVGGRRQERLRHLRQVGRVVVEVL